MISEKLKIIIIEDEPQIKQTLIEKINEHQKLKVLDSASTIDHAYRIIRNSNADAIFLDIKIKGGTGFQLINKLLLNNIWIPPIILNTGHSEFELVQQAFNDYKKFIIKILHKPFFENWVEEIENIIDLIRESHNIQTARNLKDKFRIKVDGSYHLISIEEILYINVPKELKGTGKIMLKTYNKEWIFHQSLHVLEKELIPHEFIRINRSTIINGNLIKSFNIADQEISLEIAKKSFTVGDTYTKSLKIFINN